MDKSVIDAFWKNRSSAGQGRWTDESLMEYEVGWLSTHVRLGSTILDLGSGPGELSSRLLNESSTLTLVEKYPDFLKLAPTGQNIRHVCCDLLEFVFRQTYDLILLFGVVTHLSEEHEMQIYQRAANHLALHGRLIVKNQVSLGDEKIVSGYSASLGQEYCGRYPGLEQQCTRLEGIFPNVELILYPDCFNPWPDTKHVAFVCG